MLEILRWSGLAATMFVAPLGLSALAVSCREPRARPLRLALRAAALTVLLAVLALLCLGRVGLKAHEGPLENLRKSAIGVMFLLPLLSLAGYLLLAPVVVTALLGLGLNALVIGMRLCRGCSPPFGGT